MVAVEPAPMFMVWFDPPLRLYVTVTGKAIGLLIVILDAAAFWQTEVVPLMVVIGVGRTVTVVVAAADGPLHPFAVTLMVAVPEKPGAQVTVPVVPVPEIVFPDPETVQL
jgi:hypothetical protein